MSHLTPEEVVAELTRTVPVMQEEAKVAMRDAVDLTYERESELAPHGATGELSHDITHTVRQTLDGVTGLVRPRAPYARFVEGGTGEGKTLRGSGGRAYSASTGRALSTADELADPFSVMTASGWGAKTPGRALALHVTGGVIYRSRVRGQRARHFVQRTRDAVAQEVTTRLAAGAQRATDRLFP